MNLPPFDSLPKFHNFTGCAWSVWGENDQLGTVNLLTDEVVARASKEEIRTGRSVSLNWPIHLPETPSFDRQSAEIKTLIHPQTVCVRDDVIHINTQSGTQWDGLRHFGLLEHGVMYQNIPATSLPEVPQVPSTEMHSRLGIQNWAKHGISGRGVLLDLVSYYGDSLPYDPWSTHPITLDVLQACADAQGIQFRQGDILLLRVGFIQAYMKSSTEKRTAKGDTFAGLEQSEEIKRFLWDNHFAAIASDQPALERWPTPENVPHLHQTLIGLWGMPIGEFFDLEELSNVCKKTGRYTFFFASWPLNIIGGCASTANAAAYF